jgi:hypothetical protein
VIDLGPLELIDSTGMSLLVISHRRFNLDGGGCLRLLPSRANAAPSCIDREV